jgi:hypothetical protein
MNTLGQKWHTNRRSPEMIDRTLNSWNTHKTTCMNLEVTVQI